MSIINLFHGSDHIIQKPNLSIAKSTNDYGKGFYCTKNKDLAGQWACKLNNDGIINEYRLDDSSLNILDLTDGKHNVLNWIALLLKNRIFTINDEIALISKKYLLDNFLLDIKKYDVIIGYRADDSYFSYANSFIHNSLSLSNLKKALLLGELGAQIVLVSDKGISQMDFISYYVANKGDYYPKFISNDIKARKEYSEKIKNSKPLVDDIYMIDIIRGEIKDGDKRI